MRVSALILINVNYHNPKLIKLKKRGNPLKFLAAFSMSFKLIFIYLLKTEIDRSFPSNGIPRSCALECLKQRLLLLASSVLNVMLFLAVFFFLFLRFKFIHLNEFIYSHF